MGRTPGKTEENEDVVAPISTDDLLRLVVSLTQSMKVAQEEAAIANKQLAEAILETTKPRETVLTKEQIAKQKNEEMFLEQQKNLIKGQKANRKYEQDSCDHIAGSLGETRDVNQRTSIVWHRTDAQVDIGVCTTCQRLFHPEDPMDAQGHDYSYWRRKGSFNRISAAGVRQFMDPRKAQHDSFLRDDE